MIAALFVDPNGPYVGLPNVDPWDEKRDARAYAGSDPVVAHPPCERWGRMAEGSPTHKGRFKIGDDGGCFAAAVQAVRTFGGVLEHPQGSYAWRTFGMPTPVAEKGWTVTDSWGGRSCSVDQGKYGHKAQKPTWLYAVLPSYPKLNWERAWDMEYRIGGIGYHNRAQREKAKAGGYAKKQVPESERHLTPPAFRDLLVSLAASCVGWTPPGPKNLQAVLP